MKFYPPSWNDGVKARLLVVLGFSVTEAKVHPQYTDRLHSSPRQDPTTNLAFDDIG